jgi:transcriptional regulator with XRE-family HTH domain/predicted RNase H-like HicB family nuclease
MHYVAYISREGTNVLAEFPDCPGCQTFAESSDDLAGAAREALEGWLEAHLVGGQVPPRPVERASAPTGVKIARVGVRPGLAAALAIRWARHDAKLSQKQLGDLAGVAQQQIARLENPDENPSLDTLSKVATALGLDVNVGLERPDRISLPSVAAATAARRRRSRSGKRARVVAGGAPAIDGERRVRRR